MEDDQQPQSDQSNASRVPTTRWKSLRDHCGRRRLQWIVFIGIAIILVITIPVTIIMTKKKDIVEITKDKTIPTIAITTGQTTPLTTGKTAPITTGEALSTSTIATVDINTKWIQNGTTILGTNVCGNESNQLCLPGGICIDDDDDETIYIADYGNHRIVKWKYNAKEGQVFAGGPVAGNQLNQLNTPSDVVIDKNNDSLIICDYGNRRILRWSRQNSSTGELIMGVFCWGLAMGDNSDLYISDWRGHSILHWKQGDTFYSIIVGELGSGNSNSQLYSPTYIFVDQNYTLYVSDRLNHRIMKWRKDEKIGAIVAGGHGEGSSLNQISSPRGIIVDYSGNTFVADPIYHRVICWPIDAQRGSIVVGGHGEGQHSNQLDYPTGLALDRQGNLYVADNRNHRIQKFDVDLS